MDSPNKARLRIAAVIGFTAIAGLVSGTTAGAVASSGGAVVEGAGAHPTIVVPADAWQSKCSFFVAKAADAAAVQKAAELKAEKVAAAKAKAEKLKAEKAEKAEGSPLPGQRRRPTRRVTTPPQEGPPPRLEARHGCRAGSAHRVRRSRSGPLREFGRLAVLVGRRVADGAFTPEAPSGCSVPVSVNWRRASSRRLSLWPPAWRSLPSSSGAAFFAVPVAAGLAGPLPLVTASRSA